MRLSELINQYSKTSVYKTSQIFLYKNKQQSKLNKENILCYKNINIKQLNSNYIKTCKARYWTQIQYSKKIKVSLCKWKDISN